MDEKAQVSVEYLLTITFIILLVLAATIIAFNVSSIADKAQHEILTSKEQTISTLMG